MKKRTLFIFTCTLALGLLLPARGVVPVQNATYKDWNPYSYWYYPWGKSGVHKGIDIFAKSGTPVLASTSGIVLYKGNIKLGGNVVAVLGPNWRIYYYAHLQKADVYFLEWLSLGETIGRVGTTGNAAGKPAHLHFSVITLIPNPAEITTETQGWKRMFYVNPASTFE
jgi:murein DD-endopeptidase MepM/ murein hydrolase activator NlpD